MEKQTELQAREARLNQTHDTVSDTADGTVPPGRSFGKVPKMPYFDEERDFMDSYLGRFEHFAESLKWRWEDWALYLSALLKGPAMDVYSMMPTEYANDYLSIYLKSQDYGDVGAEAQQGRITM